MNKEFKAYTLNKKGFEKAEEIAKIFDRALDDVENVLLESEPTRESNLMKTKLEEACFYAKKAMAQKKTNQEN